VQQFLEVRQEVDELQVAIGHAGGSLQAYPDAQTGIVPVVDISKIRAVSQGENQRMSRSTTQ
jgi:hypothetical protein